MKNIYKEVHRRALAERVRRLTPDAERRWGTMNASQMICHLGDQIRVATGDIPSSSSPASGPMSWPGVKQFIIYVMPWPKGKVQTARSMLTTKPDQFEADREALLQSMELFAERGPEAPLTPHPLFGKLSNNDWGGLIARHIDYHLNQFGA